MATAAIRYDSDDIELVPPQTPDRLPAMLFLAALVHGILIIGITFNPYILDDLSDAISLEVSIVADPDQQIDRQIKTTMILGPVFAFGVTIWAAIRYSYGDAYQQAFVVLMVLICATITAVCTAAMPLPHASAACPPSSAARARSRPSTVGLRIRE